MIRFKATDDMPFNDVSALTYDATWTRGVFDRIPAPDLPPTETPIARRRSFTSLPWEALMSLIEDWARSVPIWAKAAADYDQIPDRWAAMRRGELPGSVVSSAISNHHFSSSEQAEIAAWIEEIKQQARENRELTAAQISGIEQKLDDLVDASKRVGRKDWRVMIYGAAFGMIVNDFVPPHVVQGIITTVITGLGHIFGLGGMPPSLPPSA